MTSLLVRRALAQDAPAIADLVRSLGLFAHVGMETPECTLARVREHLALCNAEAGHSVFVAERPAGGLAGYGAVHYQPVLYAIGQTGYVSELFIAPDCRGQGAGTLLLQAIQAQARERGCSRLMLVNIRTRESYQRRFYAKQGWVEREDMASFILDVAGT